MVDGQPNPVRELLDMTVQQRFFPVFCLLFGIGFGLLWDAAVRRAAKPKVAMLRRLLFLLALGAGHQLLQPGEALLPYAICGLVLLLPVTFLPDTRAVQATLAALGAIGVVIGTVMGGGVVLIPALLLTGWALARLGAVARFASSHRACVIGALLCAGLAAPALWWQAQDPASAGFTTSSTLAGLLLAGAYACVVCALLPTAAGPALAAFFAPLGRTALTTYVSASLVFVAVRALPTRSGGTVEHTLGLDTGTTAAWWRLAALCAALVAGQSLIARLWLRRYWQGPLEWAWRAVTWWQVPALRR